MGHPCHGGHRKRLGRKMRTAVAELRASGSFDSISRGETARDSAQDDEPLIHQINEMLTVINL